MMHAKFEGGPYDGLILDANDIQLYTKFVPAGPNATRKFILMPSVSDWDAVRRGDATIDEASGERVVYELVRTPGHMLARFDHDGSEFSAAIDAPVSDSGATARSRQTGMYFKCYRGDESDIPQREGQFHAIDEKDRRWLCTTIDEAEATEGGFSEMFAAVGTKPSTQPLRLVIVHCENQDELVSKLSDFVD